MRIIATAGEAEGVYIANEVRKNIQLKFSSLFKNVFYKVHSLPDRTKSDLRRVREMESNCMPVVVDVHDAQESKKKVVIVVKVPMSGSSVTDDPVIATFLFEGKETTFVVEPRVIKMRGIAYAIASTLARRASLYIDFGDNK